MKNFLANYIDFSDKEFEKFMALATERTYKKNEIIFSAGAVFNAVFFVQSGLMRNYRIINGEDITYNFYCANEFATDYYSFLSGKPSSLYFEILADTTVFVFQKADLLKMYDDNDPKHERVGRMMAERAYLGAVERVLGFQTDNLETRYQRLLEKNPKLFLSIPQRHIATYLGVKPQSLSRIRHQMQLKAHTK